MFALALRGATHNLNATQPRRMKPIPTLLVSIGRSIYPNHPHVPIPPSSQPQPQVMVQEKNTQATANRKYCQGFPFVVFLGFLTGTL